MKLTISCYEVSDIIVPSNRKLSDMKCADNVVSSDSETICDHLGHSVTIIGYVPHPRGADCCSWTVLA